MPKIQLASLIYLEQLSVMKKILDLVSFKLGKESDDFKYIRQEIMNHTYNNLQKLFKKLEEEKIIRRCDKKCSIRQGYTDCICKGSGYINNEQI